MECKCTIELGVGTITQCGVCRLIDSIDVIARQLKEHNKTLEKIGKIIARNVVGG